MITDWSPRVHEGKKRGRLVDINDEQEKKYRRGMQMGNFSLGTIQINLMISFKLVIILISI